MEIQHIIKRAWELVRTHQFLWWLGALALFAGGGMAGPTSFPTPGSQSPGDPSQHMQKPGDPALHMHEWSGPSTQQVRTWVMQNIPVIVVVVMVILAILLILFYVGFSAQAGLILAVERLEEKKKAMGFAAAFKSGRVHAWRLVGLNFLIAFAALFYVAVSAAVLGFAVSSGVTAIKVALIVFFVLLVLGFIVMALFLTPVIQIAQREVVLKGARIVASLKQAIGLSRRHLGNVAVTWVMSIALGIALMLAFVAVAIVVVLLAILVGALILAVTGPIGATVFGVPAGILGGIAYLIVLGFFTAFISTYWTLAYRALTYLDTHSL